MARLKGSKSSLVRRRRDRGKRFSSDLWDTLPDCLAEEIFAKLPMSSVVRLSRVCKTWRHLILTSKISPRRASGQAQVIHFVRLFGMGKLTAFNSNRGTWEIVPLQFLESQFTLYLLVSSAGGLLCFSTATVGEYVVCNPLTKWFKRLQMPCSAATLISDQPSMPIPDVAPDSLELHQLVSSLLVVLVVDSDTGQFKLLVASLLPCSGGRTLVYDSHTDLWKKVADIPADLWKKVADIPEAVRHERPWNMHLSRTVCRCNGNLYLYFVHLDSVEETLFKYDIDQQEWSSIPLPQLPFGPILPSFIERNGKVLLLISSPKSVETNNLVGTSFALFELQETGPKLWLPTNCLPLSRYGDNWSSFIHIQCLGEGDVFFFIVRKGVRTVQNPDDQTDFCYSVKTRMTELFHNIATGRDSEVVSKWEERIVDKIIPDYQIFKPSMLGFNY